MALSGQVSAAVIAADDASDPAYSGGWVTGTDGGTGFGPWSTVTSPSSFSGGFLSLSGGGGFDQIGTGPSNTAFGMYANSSNLAQAVRPFDLPLIAGDSLFIAMDNGNIDGGGAVGLGLQNSSGQNLLEFFFANGNPNYQVSAQNVNQTSPNPLGFTNSGLKLEFHLASATSLNVLIDALFNGPGVDASYTADLNPAGGGQSISQLRLFNFNAGGGSDHDAFFNSISITSVPESSAFWFGVLSTGALSIAWYYRRITATVHSRTAA